MPTNPALIIRADANATVGAGHVMRTLALAQVWIAKGGSVTYLVSSDTSELTRRRLLRESCQVKALPLFDDLAEESRHLMSLANQENALAVVVDGYQFGEQYLNSVRSETYSTLVLDDDNRLESFDCDWLLNQNAGAAEEFYSVNDGTPKLLMGSSFALLRNEFTCHSQQPKTIKANCPNFLVTMGGADLPNVSGNVVRALSDLTTIETVRVVLGGNNQHHMELERMARSDNRIELVVDADDMSVHYRWADLAACAGGSSNWEMCYFGLPRVVIVQASNQVSIAESLHEKQACLYVGKHDAVDFANGFVDTLAALIQDRELRQRMSLNSQQLIDGRGASRVVDVLINEREVNRI